MTPSQEIEFLGLSQLTHSDQARRSTTFEGRPTGSGPCTAFQPACSPNSWANSVLLLRQYSQPHYFTAVCRGAAEGTGSRRTELQDSLNVITRCKG